MTKPLTGTKEWAAYTYNFALGCAHDCRYCYAREMACRFQRIAPEDWHREQVRPEQVSRPQRLRDGAVMVPTTHDITPVLLPGARTVLRNLLEAGNRLLITTKPHIEVVKDLCLTLTKWKDQVVWRFTIGALDEDLRAYWEPGAPSFAERLDALRLACSMGWRTSISAEPCLDIPRAPELVAAVEDFVTDTIWIGKMNKPRARVIAKSREDAAALLILEHQQADEKVRKLYEALKAHPKVRWKDSIRKVVGLEPSTESEL